MPPKQKIAREMIRDAAFQIAREEGWENISARSIAAHLHCSTQPVLYSYKSIEEIRKDAYQEADRFHSAFLMNESQSLQDDSESPESKKNEATAEDAESRRNRTPLLQIGLNYIRFGFEERHLFRFLFQSNQFQGLNVEALLSDPGVRDLTALAGQEMGLQGKEAEEAFFLLFATVHGMASLLANNAMPYDEALSIRTLTHAFEGISIREKEKENGEKLLPET